MGKTSKSYQLNNPPNDIDLDDGSDVETVRYKRQNSGVFLSWQWIFICLFGIVVLCAIVGLIVFFGHPNRCLPSNLSTEETSTTQSPAVSYRLPRDFVPSHYDIELRPDIYGPDSENFSFTGYVSIELTCEHASNVIVVHKERIEVNESTIQVWDISKNEEIPVRSTTFDDMTSLFSITLAWTVVPTEKVIVSMRFESWLLGDRNGMFWREYADGGETKYMIATQFESTYARKAFPCMDEPQLKATFNITLEHQPHMVALSNMPNYTYEVLPDGWIRSRFERTSVVMPTYLVAFVVAEFLYIENIADGPYALTAKKMRHWAQPEYVTGGYAQWAYDVSPPMFDFLEEYFNHKFPLPKTDQVCVPGFNPGAMENWGLIIYKEQRMIYKENYTTLHGRQSITGTIAHELLHMWLGNVVTCRWWSELWLQEGMARFHQHEAMGNATREMGLDWDMDAVFFSQVYYKAMDSDSTGSSHPLTNKAVETQAEASAMFSKITYDKGACIIRMARAFMGKEKFDDGMRSYVEKMQYRSAIEDDLYASWEEEAPMTPSVGEILRTWSNQMGYPLVTIRRHKSGNQIEVTQKMYLKDPEVPITEKYPSKYGYKWNIPFTFMTRQNQVAVQEWLQRKDDNFTLHPAVGHEDWILGNIGQTGFYRVNYDEMTWKALIRQLREDHTVFDVLNRAQLVQDSLQLARSGELDQVTGLDVMSYLTEEQSYLPFYAVTKASDYLDGILTRYSVYDKYREFIRSLVLHIYNSVDWTISADDPLTSTYLKSLVIETACRYGHSDCEKRALGLFDTWMEDPSNMAVIPPDLRPTIYCTAVREGGEEVWEWVLQRYLDENDVSESPVLRGALSCTEDPSLLKRLVVMVEEQDIQSKDRRAVLVEVASNVNARQFVWEHLSSSWDTVPYRSSVLSTVTKYYATKEEYTMLEDFIDARENDLRQKKEGVLARVRANMRWVERNADSVMQWLENLQ